MDNKTTCTIKEVSNKDVGQYVCKAVSDAGVTVTKAKLYVQEIPDHKKKEILIRKAKETQETVRKERVKIEKKREERRRRASQTYTETEEIKPVVVSETHVIEETKEIESTVKPERAQPILDTLEPLKTEAVASCKKVENVEEQEKPKELAQEIIIPHKSIITEQKTVEEKVTELKETKEERHKVNVDVQEKVSLDYADITEVKLDQIIERVEQIVQRGEMKMAKEVNELLEFIDVKQFGPGEQPLREIAEIGYLFKHGIAVKEITVLYQENRFPSLKTPQAQSALVNVVERKGHGALISEVLTEETTIDEKQLAATVGFRAFMKMVESEYVTIEEVITNFTPEDFISRAWESTEVTEVRILFM